MSEQTNMTEENKKTLVAFIAGLLIGGLLVYIFAIPGVDRSGKSVDENKVPAVSEENNNATEKDAAKPSEEKTKTVPTTSQTVPLNNVTFPADSGWVGIRDYEGGQLTGLLGVARWNKAENLTPTEVPLLRPTVSGKTYAIVFYSDNGDKRFDLATDAQIDAEVTTFVAK